MELLFSRTLLVLWQRVFSFQTPWSHTGPKTSAGKWHTLILIISYWPNSNFSDMRKYNFSPKEQQRFLFVKGLFLIYVEPQRTEFKSKLNFLAAYYVLFFFLFLVLDIWSPYVTFTLRTVRCFLKIPLRFSLTYRVNAKFNEFKIQYKSGPLL